MPPSGWFFRRAPSLFDRVVKGLRQSRDGDPDGAIETIAERFAEALEELRRLPGPVDAGWLRLAARLAYRSADMAGAADAARRALDHGEDASTWNLLGRIRVWMKQNDAAAAFRRAAALDPAAFVVPYRVSHQRFVRLADRALAAVPDAFQAQMSNTMIVVDDLPDLEAVQRGEDPDLLGLYEGATVLERGLPERIVLYQRNIENVAGTEAELIKEIDETMRHEIGHHFGMGEDELPY